MRLVQVTEDTTMLVSGYEHHTWQCSSCATIERQMTFTREKTLIQALPVEPTQTVPVELTQTAPVELAQMVPVETTQVVSPKPTQTVPVEPSHPEPPASMPQTNAWVKAFDEKLRNLKARATALRDAVGEVERRAQFNRVWDNLRSVPSPSASPEALSHVKPDEPVRPPTEPIASPAPTARG
jgi:hypothetical protein